MPPLTTELLAKGAPLDALAPCDAIGAMIDGQISALKTVSAAAQKLDSAAQLMAGSIRSGRSLVFVAAGSSGLMALADACELSGTFGISPDAVSIFMAGGVPVDGRMPGDVEDDVTAAIDVVARVNAGDTVIVLSASGTTPYALAVAEGVKAKSASVIGLANNPDTALLKLADVAIYLATPPEVIAGSTRLGAGTAQKAALNIMSTLMGIKLGHVYRGMMVNVVADNAKLVERAASIVSHIADVSRGNAKAAIRTANANTKAAILIAKGCTALQATDALAAHDGHLDACFKSLNFNQDENG